ncbi:FecR domain-containing protein [Pseudomonadota bacterium AL_CKDN230030165-1A_HGKHYDSX7]
MPPSFTADAASAILDEAADWMVVLNDAQVSDADRRAWMDWRARSPAHEAAWQRAERLIARMRVLPAPLAMPALDRPAQPRRRAALAKLAALALAAPAGWAAWQVARDTGWASDYRTATGERREAVLADGTRVILNTASAIDVIDGATERGIRLRAGEILIETAPDHARQRPFRVYTRQGRLEALGTRFNVNQLADATQLAVLEGAVRIEPALGVAADALELQAGQQARITSRTSEPRPLEPGATSWTRGMLMADGLALSEVVAELSRYRKGVLRCDPAIGGLRVSGTYPLQNTDRALAMLAATYPVELSTHLGGYWLTLVPRR